MPFTEGKIPRLKSAPHEIVEKELKSREDCYSRLTTDTPTKIDVYLEFIRDELEFCKHFILIPYIQVLDKI